MFVSTEANTRLYCVMCGSPFMGLPSRITCSDKCRGKRKAIISQDRAALRRDQSGKRRKAKSIAPGKKPPTPKPTKPFPKIGY